MGRNSTIPANMEKLITRGIEQGYTISNLSIVTGIKPYIIRHFVTKHKLKSSTQTGELKSYRFRLDKMEVSIENAKSVDIKKGVIDIKF